MLDVIGRPFDRVCPAAGTWSALLTWPDGICGASHVHSAVDSPYLSGDVGGGISGKEMHDARDLFGAAQSPHRDLPLDLVDDFLRYGLDHLGRDEAGVTVFTVTASPSSVSFPARSSMKATSLARVLVS